jgi:hypothetical protein
MMILLVEFDYSSCALQLSSTVGVNVLKSDYFIRKQCYSNSFTSNISLFLVLPLVEIDFAVQQKMTILFYSSKFRLSFRRVGREAGRKIKKKLMQHWTRSKPNSGNV